MKHSFFLNQQFITWSTMADHGSYVITMYKASKLHGERYRKRKEVKSLRDTKERKKKKNMKKRT